MNAYLERLQQLQGEKQQAAADRFSPYLNRPMANQPPQGGMPKNPEREQEAPPPQADMNSQFGMNFQEFSNGDKRFQEMMSEYSQLAMGLGEQVRSGYMPEAIAKKRLESYVKDSMSYFGKNEPGVLDNPQMNAVMEQMFNDQMAQQQQGGEGEPQLEAVQDPAMMAQQEGGM